MTLRIAFPIVSCMMFVLLTAQAAPSTPMPNLSPVSDQPRAELLKDPVLADVGGVKRFAGQFYFDADPTFQTGVLRKLSPSVELIWESEQFQSGERVITARVPEAELDAVMAAARLLPGVAFVEKNSIVEPAGVPNDPQWVAQRAAGLFALELERAWDVSTGLSSVRVAVLDTGLDTHPDFYLNVATGYSPLGVPQTDTTDLAATGHGTQVASIIGAARNNSSFIAGIAPNATIVPVQVCIAETTCPANVIQQGLLWVAQQGNIQVVNMSFASSAGDAGVEGQLDVLNARNVIVVAAAGNNGGSSIGWPARYGNVISVGSATYAGNRDPTSNYGPGLDVLAPFANLALNPSGYVETFTHTSSSTPVISGLAALFKSTQPVGIDNAANFLAAMKRNAYSDKAWNQETGYGVPNAFSTIWAAACVRYDFNHDNIIDTADDQAVAFRYGQFIGQTHYSQWFDVDPKLAPDGDIDIKDVASVWGRSGFRCPT